MYQPEPIAGFEARGRKHPVNVNEGDLHDHDDFGDCLRPNAAAGDQDTEGLEFVPTALSPTRWPLLIARKEISGTTTVRVIR